MRILVETGTESEWVAQTLEAAGHEVIVADPNYAPMYGELHRRAKTDRRDVAALAEANRRGWYRAEHRTSGPTAGSAEDAGSLASPGGHSGAVQLARRRSSGHTTATRVSCVLSPL